MKKQKPKKLKALKSNQNPNKKKEQLTNEPIRLSCDSCSTKFSITGEDIKSELLGETVEWRYFSCPECKLRYTTYIGDEYVERAIARRNLFRKKMRDELAKGERLNAELYRTHVRADEEEAQKIEKMTRKLKKRWNINELEKVDLH